MHTKNLVALVVSIVIIIAIITYFDAGRVVFTSGSVESTQPIATLPDAELEPAKEISTPDGFINSPNPKDRSASFTLSEFVGKKVILLDIWTYSCINCQRTLPYLNSWHEKYADAGLMIIGLHTPEFEFEKKYENVLAAVKKFNIQYPVVLDNDYSTWRAYRNQYWPRKYLIDISGNIVYDHIGEGAYEETERRIQEELAKLSASSGETPLAVPLTKGTMVARPESPETYFGSSRNENLGNGERWAVGEQTLSLPGERLRNILYLSGTWNIQKEYAENSGSGAAIEFRYKAKEVFFAASSKPGIQVHIYNDGVLQRGTGLVECREKGFCGGEDVQPDGTVLIKEDRLYKLIHHEGIEEHVLRIEIEKPGLKAFTFTFG